MTKFEELEEIVTRNKNQNKKKQPDSDNELLVPGLDSIETGTGRGSGQPHIDFADEETDMSIIDQLYRGKHKPNNGSGASSWDSTWD